MSYVPFTIFNLCLGILAHQCREHSAFTDLILHKDIQLSQLFLVMPYSYCPVKLGVVVSKISYLAIASIIFVECSIAFMNDTYVNKTKY